MKNPFSIIHLLAVCIMLSAALFPKQASFEILLGIGTAVGVVSLALSKLNKEGVLFETIGFDQARAVVTNTVVAVYRESTVVTSFFRSFFPTVIARTRYVSIETKRGTEKAASDVLRGTKGNLNQRKRSTLKTIDPPLYKEGVNINELDIYDTAFGTLDPALMAQLGVETAEEMEDITNMIERRYEIMCAQALLTGVITLVNQDNIDFKRKAASLPDGLANGGAGTYWTVTTVDPMLSLIAGGDFIRQIGKAQGDTYNVIMGGNALNAMLNNPIYQEKYKMFNITLGEIGLPQRNAVGGTLHGQISAGSYKYNVWTYTDGTEDSGVFVKYMDDDKIIILPTQTNFRLAFGQVPMLPGMSPAGVSTSGSYVLKEWIDFENTNHRMEINSAGIAIPLAIDQIYTQKVVA